MTPSHSAVVLVVAGLGAFFIAIPIPIRTLNPDRHLIKIRHGIKVLLQTHMYKKYMYVQHRTLCGRRRRLCVLCLCTRWRLIIIC